LAPHPKPQSPIPNPQSPIKFLFNYYSIIKNYLILNQVNF